MHLNSGGIERENTPRCTRYAFRWAGYQRRIHPTFHAGMHFCPFFSFFFSPPPLSLSLSLFLSFFLSPASRGLKVRSYCAPLSKNTWAWTGERVSVSDTGFNRTKWKGTRSMEISHRYFLLRSHFERIINTACYWILLYDRITLDGPAAAVKKEKKK